MTTNITEELNHLYLLASLGSRNKLLAGWAALEPQIPESGAKVHITAWMAELTPKPPKGKAPFKAICEYLNALMLWMEGYGAATEHLTPKPGTFGRLAADGSVRLPPLIVERLGLKTGDFVYYDDIGTWSARIVSPAQLTDDEREPGPEEEWAPSETEEAQQEMWSDYLADLHEQQSEWEDERAYRAIHDVW